MPLGGDGFEAFFPIMNVQGLGVWTWGPLARGDQFQPQALLTSQAPAFVHLPRLPLSCLLRFSFWIPVGIELDGFSVGSHLPVTSPSKSVMLSFSLSRCSNLKTPIFHLPFMLGFFKRAGMPFLLIRRPVKNN